MFLTTDCSGSAQGTILFDKAAYEAFWGGKCAKTVSPPSPANQNTEKIEYVKYYEFDKNVKPECSFTASEGATNGGNQALAPLAGMYFITVAATWIGF